MDKTLIEQITTCEDRAQVEMLLNEAAIAIESEIRELINAMDQSDREFIIAFYEDRIYVLNDELKDIVRYLKKKHGNISNEHLNQSTLLINNIDVTE